MLVSSSFLSMSDIGHTHEMRVSLSLVMWIDDPFNGNRRMRQISRVESILEKDTSSKSKVIKILIKNRAR